LLEWVTETEVNNYGFDIERSVGIGVWSKIGFVNGYGNSNSPKQYLFTDEKLIGGSKFVYRLKQIDTDGQYEYSEEIEVEILPTEFALYQNYPNPFNPSTVIEYEVPENSFVSLKVFDLLGKELVTLVNEEKSAGSYNVKFNAGQLASGFYIYKIDAGNFTSTKKMLLLK